MELPQVVLACLTTYRKQQTVLNHHRLDKDAMHIKTEFVHDILRVP